MTMSGRSMSCSPASATPLRSRRTSRKSDTQAQTRKVSLARPPGKVIGGKDYLQQVAIPNIYFHIAMA
jgi:hypothetical protein